MPSNDPRIVLTQVTQTAEEIADQRVKRNVVAASAILAGLVLEPEVIQRITRSDIMQESTMYQEILRHGREQGRAEAMQQVAILLLRMGMSLEQIAQTTQLTVEQIQLLQQTQEPNN